MESRKKILTPVLLVSLFLHTMVAVSQAPEKVSYQMVVRDAAGELVKESTVGVRVSILQGSAEGSTVYVENHIPLSNVNGLVSFEVGNGTPESNTFEEIDWASGPYFLKIETDPTGGTAYTINGISEILSVPYALHAKSAESVTGGIIETDPRVPAGRVPGQMQYWNGTAWVTLEPGLPGQTLSIFNGIPVWVGDPVLNAVVNPVTGKIWMDRNLGASRVATSKTDEEAYGDLYQWGRAADGHQLRSSETTYISSTTDTPGHGDYIIPDNFPYDWRSPQNDNLWQGVNGINNPCPGGFRLPTSAEWEAERLSWSSNNANGAFASPLKLPLAGFRSRVDGSFSDLGSYGYYWSSTPDATYSFDLYFGEGSNNASISSAYRAGGESVRCIKD